jgi:hypothetical protein
VRFEGIERVTIELAGECAAPAALPDGLTFDGRVSLFAFYVDDLRIRGVPFARSSYAEVLWRIGVRYRGEPAWWAVACDLEARLPAIAARRWVRYPVRRNALEVSESRVRIADTFGFSLGPDREPANIDHRILLTGNLYEVPWGDDASGAHTADVSDLTDTLGRVTVGTDISWSSTAIVRRGRRHRCGVAQRR